MVEFLSLKKDAFGIEITNANIRMMKLARRAGRIEAVAAGMAPLEEGVIENETVKDEKKLAAAIKKLAAKVFGSKKPPRYAVASLPESRAFWQVVSLPRLNDQEARAAVIFEAENYIPLPLEKVYLDFEILPPVDANASKLEAAVAAIPREIVDARLRAIDGAGFVPLAMELESQSVARAAASVGPLTSAMIIQIGDGKSEVIILARDSTRFVFSIPISNGYFVDAIAAAVKVDRARAEILKSKCGIEELGRSKSAGDRADQDHEQRLIFEALIPGLVDFVQQIQKCVRYCQTHGDFCLAEGKNFERVMICGRGSDLKGLDDFLAAKLGAPVERMVLPIGTGLLPKTSNFGKDDGCGNAVVAGLAVRAMNIEAGCDDDSIETSLPKIRRRMNSRFGENGKNRN